MHCKSTLSWTSLLIENLLLWSMTDKKNVADAEWMPSEFRMPEVDERGVWRMMDPRIGPFQPPDSDRRNWIKYVHSGNEIVRKRIRNIESLLSVTGLTYTDSLSRETYGKIPEGDNNKGDASTSETPLMKTIRDSFPAIQHHLELLRNWSDYLSGLEFEEETPVEAIHEVLTEMSANLTNPSEMNKLNQMIGEMLKKRKRHGKVIRTGDTRRKLWETFRSISLEEVKQMSKIVDFVERYRGNLSRSMA